MRHVDLKTSWSNQRTGKDQTVFRLRIGGIDDGSDNGDPPGNGPLMMPVACIDAPRFVEVAPSAMTLHSPRISVSFIVKALEGASIDLARPEP